MARRTQAIHQGSTETLPAVALAQVVFKVMVLDTEYQGQVLMGMVSTERAKTETEYIRMFRVAVMRVIFMALFT